MMICDANNLWDKKNPQVRKQCWEKITSEYNTQQKTNFTKAQVVMRYKNYRLQLKMEKTNEVDHDYTKNKGIKIHKTVKSGKKVYLQHFLVLKNGSNCCMQLFLTLYHNIKVPYFIYFSEQNLMMIIS